MRDKTGAVVLLCVMAFAASAQQDSTASKAGWFASLHVGTLIPEPGNTASLSVQMMQGIRYDRIRLGVGVGFDVYEYWNMLPIFTGVSCDVLQRNEDALYIQVNGGYAKASSRLPDELSFALSDDGGYFVHPMVGYRLRQGKVALHLTCGYKIQKIHYRHKWGAWGGGWGTPVVASVVQDVERLTLQVGIGLP